MTSLGLFVLLSLLWISCTSELLESLCPTKCVCTANGHVNCQNGGFTSFPKDLSPNTQVLDLRHNSLTRLSRSDLRGLDRLETLFLGGNQIRHLDEDLLDSVPVLKRLYIGRNQLRNLPKLTSRVFSHLLVFDVHGNHLSHVNNDAFNGLVSLERVHLGHNYLQHLSLKRIFEQNSRLAAVHLAQNPWNCDCRIKETIEFLRSHGEIEGEAIAKCQNPPTLRGTPVRDLDLSTVRCFDGTAIESTNGPILNCASNAAARRTQWLFDDMPLDASLSGSYEILDNGSLLLYQSNVNVHRFKCSIDYVVGVARPIRQLRASQQTQSTSQAPQFTYTPRDRSYREGASVKLNCEVQGHPRPSIRWAFNGKTIEGSRKHELRKDDTQLIIYPFLEHDVGTYSCDASNQFGRIQTSARLGIIKSAPPVITEGPKSIRVRPGTSATLRCVARGDPTPQIVWSFGGSEIPLFKGHYTVNADGSQLTIQPVGRADEGVYSCMAGNAVGSMTGDARLSVDWSQLDYVDSTIDNNLLKTIVNEATDNIERAVAETKEDLRGSVQDPGQLMRHFQFAIKRPVELTKAREIYEESLRLIEKHVERGLRFKPTDIPTNVSYESVLSVTHIQTLMELSGCMNGQFTDACTDMCFHSKYRSYTGQCNNWDHPTWGVSQMPFIRLLPPIYENGFNTPVGWDPDRKYFGYTKPNPRSVSTALIRSETVSAHSQYTAMLMQWGQFLDHDITFKAPALARQTFAGGAICNRTCENVAPCFNIPLPEDDPRRKTQKYPCIEVERSAAICGSGETSPIFRQVTYREQTNIITSFIDASNVYGSTEVDALDLRDLFGDHGLLRFDIVAPSQKPYMPFEKDSAMECRRNVSVDNPIRCFLAGDGRANEQIALTAMHTIWFREHNRIAAKLLEMNADWDGERIYQEARKIIGAMMQKITYSDWLPKVLGRDGYDHYVGKYMGYNPEVDPSISNEFATAAFRFGHTIINPTFDRLDENFKSISNGPLPLQEAFFAPERLLSQGGIDPLLRGLFAKPLKRPMTSQLLTKPLVDKLFYRSENVSMDLAAINIQRGRDHGIPGYLEYRRFCNLTVPETWEELMVDVGNSEVLDKLKRFYGHPGNLDLWVGGIIEKVIPGALVGPTFACIIGDQFKRLRDGDRFWYENPDVFSTLQVQQLRKSNLAKVICNNADSIEHAQNDVFKYVGEDKEMFRKCSEVSDVELKFWMSCCDETCSARETMSETKQKRRRRSHHLYAASHSPHVQENCDYAGATKLDGTRWQLDSCTTCKCTKGKVWCSTDKHCKENK
ncbi:Leucine-rich repeat and Immunoglobulin I-set and heme peroxidase domain containing protein [Aphelenchoides besseyi]|nr:Leucine-rich repeat and Immunoglobulin I-set and heme peroxidase domain containing protein [Aphelenchoides besseyi]